MSAAYLQSLPQKGYVTTVIPSIHLAQAVSMGFLSCESGQKALFSGSWGIVKAVALVTFV